MFALFRKNNHACPGKLNFPEIWLVFRFAFVYAVFSKQFSRSPKHANSEFMQWVLCILRHKFFSSSAAYCMKARLGGIA